MVNLPVGVQKWDRATAQRARQRATISVTGRSKSGKSFFCTHTQHPLYYVLLDPHDNLDASLDHAAQQGYTGDVFTLVVPTVPYASLTQDEAKRIVKSIEDFASWAKVQATLASTKGEPCGTFVIDGMQKLKGYIEKAYLGESTTLGWRPGAGSSAGISTFDYGTVNNILADILAGFNKSFLDLIITWEGRRKYIGKERTDQFVSKIPDSVEYPVNAHIECIMDLEPVVANNQIVAHVAVPKVRIGNNGYNQSYNGRVLKTQSLDDLKKLFGLRDDSVLEPEGYKPAILEGSDPLAEDAST